MTIKSGLRKLIVIEKPIIYEEEKNVHACQPLAEENVLRNGDGEMPVHIFRDFDNEKWNISIGLEFVRVNCCPFCMEKL